MLSSQVARGYSDEQGDPRMLLLLLTLMGCGQAFGLEGVEIESVSFGDMGLFHWGVIGGTTSSAEGPMTVVDTDGQTWLCTVVLRGPSVGVDVGATEGLEGLSGVVVDLSEADGVVTGEQLFTRYNGMGLHMVGAVGVNVYSLRNRHKIHLDAVDFGVGLSIGFTWEFLDIQPRGDCEAVDTGGIDTGR